MGDDSIDLSDISAIAGGGDNDNDDNPMLESKKELTMAE